MKICELEDIADEVLSFDFFALRVMADSKFKMAKWKVVTNAQAGLNNGHEAFCDGRSVFSFEKITNTIETNANYFSPLCAATCMINASWNDGIQMYVHKKRIAKVHILHTFFCFIIGFCRCGTWKSTAWYRKWKKCEYS